MDITLLLEVVIRGILIGGVYSLVAAGLNLITGVTSLINFSHGELFMLAMYATFWLSQLTGLDPYLSLFVTVPMLFVIGLLIQRGLFQRVLGAPHENQLLIAAGLMYILQNIALIMWTADFRQVTTSYRDLTVNLGGMLLSVPRLVTFTISMGVGVVLYLFLKKSRIGNAIRATAQDRVVAALMGIDVNRIYMVTFGIGSALAAVAGTCVTLFTPVFPTIGSYYILTAFAIIVLGGLGNFIGALIGGLVIGVVQSLAGVYIAVGYQELMSFAIVIVVLSFRPQGMFGKLGRKV